MYVQGHGGVQVWKARMEVHVYLCGYMGTHAYIGVVCAGVCAQVQVCRVCAHVCMWSACMHVCVCVCSYTHRCVCARPWVGTVHVFVSVCVSPLSP